MPGRRPRTPALHTQDHDLELVARVRRGDRAGLHELVDSHLTLARRSARRLSSDPDVCHDAVTTAFVRIIRAVASGERELVNFDAYLAVAVRREVQYLGRARRAAAELVVEPTELERIADGRHAGDAGCSGERDQRVMAALGSLRPTWSTAVWRAHVDGVPPRELGGELNISPNAAAALTHRARRALLAELLAGQV